MSGGGVHAGLMFTPAKNLTIGVAGSFYSSLDISTAQRRRLAGLHQNWRYHSTIHFCYSNALHYWLRYFLSFGQISLGTDILLTDFSSFSYREGKSNYTSGQRVTFGISRLGTFAPGTSFGDRINFNMGGGYETLPFTVKRQNYCRYISYCRHGIAHHNRCTARHRFFRRAARHHR